MGSEMELSIGAVLVLLFAMIAIGWISGLVAGLLGVGGGIVIVPLIYYGFTALGHPSETLMQVTLATSLASIAITSSRALLAHHRSGAVDWHLLRHWMPGLVMGAALAVALAAFASSPMLMGFYALTALALAVDLAFGRRDRRLGPAMPTGLKANAVSGGMGAISTLTGVGGGTFALPLQAAFGVELRRAVAGAAGMGVIVAAPAALGLLLLGLDMPDRPPFSIGYLHLPAFASITVATIFAAPYGVRLAHGVKPRSLRLLVALFLAITALNMLRMAFYG